MAITDFLEKIEPIALSAESEALLQEAFSGDTPGWGDEPRLMAASLLDLAAQMDQER
ncbi:hypothetical protein [Propionivibrio dicarboxylicus]|uniref:Uncharacterized protein n=1 Tax=Propionivibrio dicarboxylicus TaxID=83767 RepID=A0A1G8EKW0_9RHOO|nr:hypothetical protein [Propionivibrio dicarboxylicus]SDH70593.1 hypothetical protein SAMN05660652_02117 [Propionivibrio dicarboxylicus]